MPADDLCALQSFGVCVCLDCLITLPASYTLLATAQLRRRKGPYRPFSETFLCVIYALLSMRTEFMNVTDFGLVLSVLKDSASCTLKS